MKRILWAFILSCFLLGLTGVSSPGKTLDELFFTIQIGAFLNQQNALGLEKKMIGKGFSAYIDESSTADGRKIYRVRVGKFKTKKEAETHAKSFYRKEKIVYLIIEVNPKAEISSEKASRKAAETTSAYQETKERPRTVAEVEKDKNPEAAVSGWENRGNVQDEEQETTTGLEEDKEESQALSEIGTHPEIDQALQSTEDSGLPPESSVTEQEGHGDFDVAKKEEVASEERTKEERLEEEKGAPLHQKWPEKVSRIYTYREPGGALHVTNIPEKIPKEQRRNVESISVFPVKFMAFNVIQKLLYLDVEERVEPINLVGVEISSPEVAERVEAYFNEKLRDVPLRLEYTPKERASQDDAVIGDLSFREGGSVGLDLVRQGIAPSNLENVPVEKRKAWIDAEESARAEALGIWAPAP